MDGARATLRLLSACNNACVFCAQAGGPALQRSADQVGEGLRALRAGGASEVTFTGGEPAGYAGLLEAVAQARALGFSAVGLQTNGRGLRGGAFAADLAAAGLTDVHLSLHGLGAALHDHHTGVPGSFAEASAGIASARVAGLTVAVSTVLTRSNGRSLGELAPWLAARGVAAWCVSVPVVAGSLRERFDPVFPRLAIALPYALHALAAARRDGVAIFLRGAPSCLLGPFAARALPEAPRAFDAARCGQCPAKGSCAGVDPVYLARFAGDELSAGRAPKGVGPRFVGREAALARMFVGAGPLVIDGPGDHAGG
jgi:hypothetical protein